MKLRTALFLALMLTVQPLAALAGLSQDTLSRIGFEDRRGAALPGDLRFDMLGKPSLRLSETLGARPALLLFADYTCTTMCGLTFDALALALEQMPADSNINVHALVIGLDPKDGPAEAEAFRAIHLRQNLNNASFDFLTGTAESIAALTKAAGFSYAYDSEQDQFAHPTGVVVATADGRVSKVLDWQALTPFDLRLAWLDAGQDKIGSLADRIAMVCYGWDAARGIYTLQIKKLLGLASLATILMIGAGVAWAIGRGNRKRLGSSL
jgi:protein SCO1/2